MKTIGLLGGMSWESSAEYYRIINQTVKERLGGLHSAQCVLYSVDFADIELMQREARWNDATEFMIDAARRLEKAGADCVIICTNTMHKMADDIKAAITIPLLHIADAAAEAILSMGLTRVALLGTKFTMEQDFYKGRLRENDGLEVMIPGEDDREIIHNVIYHELCLGKIRKLSRGQVIRIIERLVHHGAEGVVLGCTELPMLIKQQDCSVPLFDTTEIHAKAAVEFALRM